MRDVFVGAQCALGVAAVTFIALAFMALRFARPDAGYHGGARRTPRTVYLWCGGTILACVALAAAANLLPASVQANWSAVFVFEALAVVAFGVSWFVKGEAMTGVLSRVRRRRLPSPQRPANLVSKS